MGRTQNVQRDCRDFKGEIWPNGKTCAAIGKMQIVGETRPLFYLVTKKSYQDLWNSLIQLRDQMLSQEYLRHLAVPKVSCGLDKLNWRVHIADFGFLIPYYVVRADGPITYEVYKYMDYMKTWDEASEYCQDTGMGLAFIRTYDEHKNLVHFLKSQNLLPETELSGYWLGAKYRDGIWEWETPGTNVRADDGFKAGWHVGEPNYKEKNGVKQDCIELKYIQGNNFTESLGWNDMWCNERRGFICQHLGSKPSE